MGEGDSGHKTKTTVQGRKHHYKGNADTKGNNSSDDPNAK